MRLNPSCVSLGKPLSLSELWFLPWQKQGSYFLGLGVRMCDTFSPVPALHKQPLNVRWAPIGLPTPLEPCRWLQP